MLYLILYYVYTSDNGSLQPCTSVLRRVDYIISIYIYYIYIYLIQLALLALHLSTTAFQIERHSYRTCPTRTLFQGLMVSSSSVRIDEFSLVGLWWTVSFRLLPSGLPTRRLHKRQQIFVCRKCWPYPAYTTSSYFIAAVADLGYFRKIWIGWILFL